MTAVAGTIGTSWMSTAGSDRKVSKIIEDRNTQQGHQQQQQELATTSSAEGRPATKGMPEIVEMPTTVLA